MDFKWENYFNDRLRYNHPSGFVIIIPKECEHSTPLWCGLCDMVMKTSDDTIYYKKYGCCSKCGMKWADANQQKWIDGWRPNTEEIEKEKQYRKFIPLSIDYKVFIKS